MNHLSSPPQTPAPWPALVSSWVMWRLSPCPGSRGRRLAARGGPWPPLHSSRRAAARTGSPVGCRNTQAISAEPPAEHQRGSEQAGGCWGQLWGTPCQGCGSASRASEVSRTMGHCTHAPVGSSRQAGQAAGHGGGRRGALGCPQPCLLRLGVCANAAIHFPPKSTPLSDLKLSLIPQ